MNEMKLDDMEGTMSPYLTYLGPSSDLRTNRWRITCPTCGSSFEPPTTMFARQVLECTRPKCKSSLSVDYNLGSVRVVNP
jgi:hypothetical protein